MSVNVPDSQTNFVNDVHDDSTPNAEVNGPPELPPMPTESEKKEIANMSYKELEAKLEEEKKDKPPVQMPLSE